MRVSRKSTASKKAVAPKRRRAAAMALPADPIVSAKLRFAMEALSAAGKLYGARSKRMSARVDPGLLKAARSKTGLTNDSELVSEALAVLAASDDFGPWFAAQAGRLPKDIDLDF